MRPCTSQASRSSRAFRALLSRIRAGLTFGTQLLLSLRSGTWAKTPSQSSRRRRSTGWKMADFGSLSRISGTACGCGQRMLRGEDRANSRDCDGVPTRAFASFIASFHCVVSMPAEETVVLCPFSCSYEDACLPGESLTDDLEAVCPESATPRIPANGGTAPASKFCGIVDHQYGSPGGIQLVLRDLVDPRKQRVLRDLLYRLGVSRELEVPCRDVIADGAPVGDEQAGDEYGHGSRGQHHDSACASIHLTKPFASLSSAIIGS